MNAWQVAVAMTAGSRALAIAAVLTLLHAAPRAQGAADSPAGEIAPPAPRSQVFQRSRSTFEVQAQGHVEALSAGAARAEVAPQLALSLAGLARGTLLQARLNEDAALTLRLRGGAVGLFLSLRLDSR